MNVSLTSALSSSVGLFDMSSLVETLLDLSAGKVPKSAKDMASMTELLPAPMTPIRTLTPALEAHGRVPVRLPVRELYRLYHHNPTNRCYAEKGY